MNPDLEAIMAQNRVIEFGERYLVLMLPKSKVDMIRDIPKSNWCVAFDLTRIIHFNYEPIIVAGAKHRVFEQIPGTESFPMFWRYFSTLKTTRQAIIAKGEPENRNVFYLAIENPYDPNFFSKMRGIFVTEDENISANANRSPFR